MIKFELRNTVIEVFAGEHDVSVHDFIDFSGRHSSEHIQYLQLISKPNPKYLNRNLGLIFHPMLAHYVRNNKKETINCDICVSIKQVIERE